MSKRAHVCVCVRVRVCVLACMRACVHVCVRVRACVCMSVCMYACERAPASASARLSDRQRALECPTPHAHLQKVLTIGAEDLPVERHGPGADGAQIGHHPLQAVGQRHAHHLPLAHALLPQPRRELAGQHVHLEPREHAPLPRGGRERDEGLGVGVHLAPVVDQLLHRLTRHRHHLQQQ